MHCDTYGLGGDPGKPPSELIFLHGWGLHGGVWQDVVPAFADRFRVLVPDLPGYGRSRILPPAYTLNDLVTELVSRLHAPAVWVGWSLGALVALTAALERPEAVKKLVLVAATPRFVQGPDWRCAVSTALLQDFAQEFAADYARTLQRFISLQLGVGTHGQALLRRLRPLLLAHGAPPLQVLQAGLTLLRDTDLRSRLVEVAAPALVVQGGRDRLVPPAAAEYLARHLPQAQLHIVADAGHAPFLSHTSEFLQQVSAFL